MNKTIQCKLSFPQDGNIDPALMEEQMAPLFQVSEIEISYNPVVKPSERVKIECSADAEKVFRRIWCKPIELIECFYALFLNRANKVLGYYLISIGGISGTLVDIRTVYQAALKANACSVIFAHYAKKIVMQSDL
jgi:DNA repair protein RadC